MNGAKSGVEKSLLKNVPSQKNQQSFVTKHVTKEEKFKRRLFEDEKSSVNNENTENAYNNRYTDSDAIRYTYIYHRLS